MPEKRLEKNPSVVCTEMDGGAVLLDLDTTRYYSLNPTALEIWSLLDRYPTAEAIAHRLATDYDIDVARATASTERILSELARENLLRGDTT